MQHGAEDSVALIDDLHWIDDASAAWVEQWVEAIAGTRFVLIVNFRPELSLRVVRPAQVGSVLTAKGRLVYAGRTVALPDDRL